MTARKVLHASRIRQFKGDVTITGTLCGRARMFEADGMNIAVGSEAVTCKFCLRRLAVEAKRAALSRSEP